METIRQLHDRKHFMFSMETTLISLCEEKDFYVFFQIIMMSLRGVVKDVRESFYDLEY